MKKVSLVVSKDLQSNNLLNKNSADNRDNIFQKYIELKKEFCKNGYSVATSDIHSIKSSNIAIYFSIPRDLPDQKDVEKSFLLLNENIIVKPDDYAIKNHAIFKKIFTFDDSLVDNIKYFKLNFSHLFPRSINKDLTTKIHLCTLIAANKKLSHPLALNSERVKVIRWFEKNHIKDFDLYGVDWDKHIFGGPKIVRALNRVAFIQKMFSLTPKNTYPSYKGSISNKKTTLEKYKFSICYENVKDVPGYITEKIFDSFFAGCVPIYWGANNVLDYIPEGCFIDKRSFDNYDELYDFIVNMKDNKYKEYLDNIETFLHSVDGRVFSAEIYAKNLVSGTLINNVDDKGVSLGEGSVAQLTNITVRNSGMAVASKDGSIVNIVNSTINNSNEISYASYMKKPVYGRATLNVKNNEYYKVLPRYKVQEGNVLTINGKKIEGVDIDVKSMYKR